MPRYTYTDFDTGDQRTIQAEFVKWEPMRGGCRTAVFEHLKSGLYTKIPRYSLTKATIQKLEAITCSRCLHSKPRCICGGSKA